MGKEKEITQKYVSEIIDKNPNVMILTKTYVDYNSVIELYCKKHNVTYKQRLRYAIDRNGCNCCKEEEKHDRFLDVVKNRNPHIDILEQYTHQGQSIRCRCNVHGVNFVANSASLSSGNGGCPICFNESKQKRRTSSDVLKEKFHKLNPELTIIDENVKLNEWINVYCNVCNHTFKKKLTTPYITNKKCHCSVCTNRTIVPGFNDMATLRPDLVKYFKNKEEANLYGPGQTKKIIFVCPDCGHEKIMKIEVFVRIGFCCPCCGDGVSYPNKFARRFLQQLNVDDLKFEYYPEWGNGCFYDCYFKYNGVKYILEMDGIQHFKHTSNFKMTYDEIHLRDIEKNIMAEKNGHKLIRIDARYSNKEHIISSIMKSELSELFDLSFIDWDMCDLHATSNLVKIICDYVQHQKSFTYKEIKCKFGLCADTIRSYIKRGISFSWCDDNIFERLTW